MALPVLNPHHAMWAAAGMLAGSGLTLIAVCATRSEPEPLLVPLERATPSEMVTPDRVMVHPILQNEQPLTPASEASCAISGQIRGPSDQCCWYGQRWSVRADRCIGMPWRCPDGRVASGEECVIQKPALSTREVELSIAPHRARLDRCLTSSAHPSTLWLSLSIDVDGQAFHVRPGKAQPWTTSPSGRRVVQCVQDVMVQVRFPRGHRTTHAHHLAGRARTPQ